MAKYIHTYSGGIYTYTYSDGTLVEIPVLPKSLKQAITPQPKEDKEYGRNKQSNFNRKPRCKTRG